MKYRFTLLLLCALAAGCSHRPAPVFDRSGGAQSAQQINKKSYTVRRGDTLYSIAFAAGLDYREVAAWNRIRPPYRIYPGQRLRLIPVKTRTGSRRYRPSVPHKPPVSRSVKSWVWPTRGRIIRGFALKQQQTGIDIAGRHGQGVHAAAPGRVVYAGSGLRGYGKLIIVKHNEVFLSAYAHNRKILIREGKRVAAGQRIAEMGDTGTDRVKLHFEIRKDGRPVDPIRYLPKP